MASVRFTARYVAGLNPRARRVDYWDSSLSGFGLRVSTSGVKTWCALYRHKGRLRRLTIGRYPLMSLAEARDLARTHLHNAAIGRDPALEKRHQRSDFDRTVGRLFRLYEITASRKKSWPEEARIIRSDVLPGWRNRVVSEITRQDVRLLVEQKAAKAPVMANRLLARLSRLFNFAIDQDWLESNPASRVPKPSRERSRDRVLSPKELRELWAALEAEHGLPAQPGLPSNLRDLFRVLLLTAQRLGEVSRMQWSSVDLDAGWWTIPAADAKNGTEHRVPLSPAVLAIVSSRRELAAPDSVFVFCGRVDCPPIFRAKKAASVLSRGLSFSFRAHDLRRTAASGMAQGGVPRDHIAHVLNHRSVTRSTVTAIYDRYNYDAEKLAAVVAWGRALQQLVSLKNEPAVLEFQRRA